MISDADIIKAVFRDSKSGFRILFQAKWESVYWHIRRMVIRHTDAQDATQETFVRIFRSFDKFNGSCSLNAWIYRIATNEALRLISRRRDDIISLDDNGTLDIRQIPDEEYVNYADAEAVKLQNAILSLPTKQQLAFTLRYYDELGYEDIANIIGSTPSSAKASYHIAKDKIIRYMNA